MGQLNVSDTVTRMVLSVVATGIAPDSFFQLDADGNRQRAHLDGLPVDFVAEAIATLGAQVVDGFETYHVMNPHDDGIGPDEYVDWLIEAGYPIQRIGDFGEWLQRFETALGALPDRQREHSMLQMLLLRIPSRFSPRADPRVLRADRPHDSVLRCKKAKIGPDKDIPDIPHVSAPIILKYVTDLQLLDCSPRLRSSTPHSAGPHRQSPRNKMRRIALSIYWAFLTVVGSFSLLRQKDAAAYYTSLGDDVIDFMNEGYVDNSKPLWLNLGYWKVARTYPDACVAMVELLGTRAGLQPSDGASTSVSVSRSKTLFFSIASRCLTSRASTSHPSTSIRAGNESPGAGWRNKSTFDSVPRPQWSFPTHHSKKCWPWNAHSTLTRVINSCAKHFASSNQEEPLRSPTCSRIQARNPA